MDFNRQVIPEAYFDVRLPSRICLLIIVCLGLAVAIFLAWFTFKVEKELIKTTTYQNSQVVRDQGAKAVEANDW